MDSKNIVNNVSLGYYDGMKIKLPENAKKILDTMHEAGFEAYVVGGCVRDAKGAGRLGYNNQCGSC